jgi:glutamine amidotransferase
MKVTLADLGIGNIHSLSKALQRQGATVDVTAEPDAWLAARVLVLPGVGSFGAGLRRLGPVRDKIKAHLDDGIPCLGVCLGMQLLMTDSEEDEGQGIDRIRGHVARFPKNGPKVPHMGWTPVVRRRDDAILDGIDDGTHFYFVHSYYVGPSDDVAVAYAEHGVRFAAVVRKGNTVATQFHPEKSAEPGLRLIRNFLAEAEAAA